MNSSPKGGRVFRAAAGPDEVYVLGQEVRSRVPAPAAIATAADLVAAAEARAALVLEAAEAEAARLVAAARAEVDAVRRAAFAEGDRAGREEAAHELDAYVALARQAAAEGKAVRDGIAGQAAAVVAQAVALAVRRVVGEYYEADPARTAAICAEALRAASGQEVLRLRVNPAVADAVRAALVAGDEYVRPDEGVAVGGCIIDLRHGTVDATLDARLSMMALALADAGGEVAA